MREITLTKNKIAIIDDADWDAVTQHSWHALVPGVRKLDGENRWYAARGIWIPERSQMKRVYLHRFILDASADQMVDHINGNGLDCRRENLRIVTTTQNCVNRPPTSRTGLKGVYEVRSGKFLAYIGKECTHLGLFDSAEEAGRCYDTAAAKRYGEFARLNFPTGV